MNVVGLRVEPRIINYTIIKDNGDFFPDKLMVPVYLDMPRRLSYIRSNLLSIIKENGISYIGLRVIEPQANNINLDRVNIEGVIQELMCDCKIEGYKTFIKSQIKSALHLDDFKQLKDLCANVSVSSPDDIHLEYWNSLSVNQKESILVAMCIRGDNNGK
ncbi:MULTISPECIES: hypothetical protein [Enterococcus]|uniref:Uncharacterized protein n=2 Tax=Enterococcus TaxID=1350 RepID=A0ABV0EX81_9ENTE|nr:hypothetical protein [Enterococcus sp. 665A]MBO1341414.1 hypothetical protein [Enterococcus sp. 665A]